MKKILLLLGVFCCANSMDKPPQQTAKPAAQPPTASTFEVLATDFFRVKEFKELLNRGIEISAKELEELLPLATEKGYPNVWFSHGPEFLIKLKLALPSGPQQTSTTSKGSMGQLSEQARDSVLKAYKTELKELFGVGKKESEGQIALLPAKIEEKTVNNLWQSVLNLDNVPLSLEVIKEIRQDLQDADKKEPAIISFMIDDLVKKICRNILNITKYLREKRLLDDFVQNLNKHYASEIRAFKAMNSDYKFIVDHQRAMIGMLTSNQQSCPIFVKEKVLEMTQPKKGFISSLKGLFTP